MGNPDVYKSPIMSVEALPPVTIDGRQHMIGISIDESKKEVSIYHHTIAEGETDKAKIRNPEDCKSITIPFLSLGWFAPRIENARNLLKIEDEFKKRIKR